MLNLVEIDGFITGDGPSLLSMVYFISVLIADGGGGGNGGDVDDVEVVFLEFFEFILTVFPSPMLDGLEILRVDRSATLIKRSMKQDYNEIRFNLN
ncbi:unnamed protein product [Anisakis simplex]|uniref:Uncharacterized protein n=1 Tax=Anisakis simplex TaxID=6269 RepID=A0A0M3J1Z8_ANISI|nr:unnamed protein product [Anisakis simplex]